MTESQTFQVITALFESSEADTDTDNFEAALYEAFEDVIENIEIEWIDTSDWDTEDDLDYVPGNFGQYTQPIIFTFKRPITEDEFHARMDKIDGDVFGFGNGYELQ